MKIYTRSLIVVIMIITLITLYAAASQGWWVVSFRNPEIIDEYQQEQRAHTGTAGYYGRGKSGRLRNRSNRSFRGGSRRGGK